MKGLAISSAEFKALQRWVPANYTRTKVIDKAPARVLAGVPGVIVEETNMDCLRGGTKKRKLTIDMLVNKKGLETLGDIFFQFDTAPAAPECLLGHCKWHSALSFKHQKFGNRFGVFTPRPVVTLTLVGHVDGKEANINMLLGIIAAVTEKIQPAKEV